MKQILVILCFLVCGVTTVRADIASTQYVESLVIPADWEQEDSTATDYIKNKPTIPSTASDIGLGNVQNVDQTNASNLTSGTVGVARLPVGTTSTTVAAGNDARFDTVSTTQPSGTPPTGQVFIWFE